MAATARPESIMIPRKILSPMLNPFSVLTLDGWYTLFQAVAAVAVAVTVVLGFLSNRQLKRELSIATEATAKALQSANEAQLAAFRERFERERMEELSYPRKLNLLRYGEYLESLRRYAGTRFFIATLTDTETTRTAKMIEQLLLEAGWQSVGPNVRFADADETEIPDMIWVEFRGYKAGLNEDPLVPAADALVDVLTSSKIGANSSQTNRLLRTSPLPDGSLRIVVGLKPNPYLDMKKFEREAYENRMRNPPKQ